MSDIVGKLFVGRRTTQGKIWAHDLIVDMPRTDMPKSIFLMISTLKPSLP